MFWPLASADARRRPCGVTRRKGVGIFVAWYDVGSTGSRVAPDTGRSPQRGASKLWNRQVMPPPLPRTAGYQLQIRSADEPMTTCELFLLLLECS